MLRAKCKIRARAHTDAAPGFYSRSFFYFGSGWSSSGAGALEGSRFRVGGEPAAGGLLFYKINQEIKDGASPHLRRDGTPFFFSWHLSSPRVHTCSPKLLSPPSPLCGTRPSRAAFSFLTRENGPVNFIANAFATGAYSVLRPIFWTHPNPLFSYTYGHALYVQQAHYLPGTAGRAKSTREIRQLTHAGSVTPRPLRRPPGKSFGLGCLRRQCPLPVSIAHR